MSRRAVRREAPALAGVLVATACALAPGCRREAPPGDVAPTPSAPSTSTSSAASPSASASSATAKKAEPTRIDVVLAGDAIPQVKVLGNDLAQVFARMPAYWAAADARVLNLEAPVGERKGLPGDKSILAYAAPPAWFGKLWSVSKASAFVVANNHACDLGPEGLAATVAEGQKAQAKVVGAHAEDPWTRVEVAKKDGRTVCVVAWTTFLNDKGKKQKGCLEGAAGAKVARAELGKAGIDLVHQELGKKDRWAGCDARIAFVHAGREYKPQIRPVMDQATAAAAHVDAVIVSHPHVPDVVEVVHAPAPPDPNVGGGRVAGRPVPVFRSLGNFVSNQGIAWTPGMSVELLEVDGVPDPIRTVWTRVAMLARLRFAWDPALPGDGGLELVPPRHVYWGYGLLFTEREAPITIRLRPLPDKPASGPLDLSNDPIAQKLAKGPKPFSELLKSPCLLAESAAPVCEATTAPAPALEPSAVPSSDPPPVPE